MNNPFTDIFLKLPPQTVSPEKQQALAMVIKMCDVMSSLNNQSVFCLDYSSKTFPYMSPNQLFLCGYEIDEAMAMGVSFVGKIMPPDSLQMLAEIFQMGWKFMYSLPIEEETPFRVSYDIYLQHRNGDKILVNMKVAPLLFTEDGKVWVSVCVVSHSSRKEAGNVVFMRKDKNLYYRYHFDTKKFVEYVPEKLTRREEEVLRLSMQGYNENGIAEQMNISVITVRNHRNNAKEKLGVRNLANAVGAFNFGLQVSMPPIDIRRSRSAQTGAR